MEPSAAPERPHARLTRLPWASDALAATLEPHEKEQLLEDAARCVDLLRDRGERCAAHVELAFVAAALALLCGRFVKRNGQSNPSAAATACGKPTKNPKLVTAWIGHLQQLEAALHAEEEAAQERQLAIQAVADERAAQAAAREAEIGRRAALLPMHALSEDREARYALYEAGRDAAKRKLVPKKEVVQALSLIHI